MADSTIPHAGKSIAEHVEKELKFLELFLLMFNKACPINRIDLKWAEEGPVGRVGLNQQRLCTEAALAGPCGRLLTCDNVPEPVYCNIVHDHGRHEAESCAKSDRAAEMRVRETRKPEVYQCHAGLVDIAVPVICEGRHIATLFTGQVLREPPSREAFVQIRKQTASLTYIKVDELEKAYWRVPVVSDAEIQKTIEILEVFAEYLVLSWRRLSEVVREQQRAAHELQLQRKEFALMLLEGNTTHRPELRELMKRIGFKQYPNRVLTVAFEPDEKYRKTEKKFDVAYTQAIHSVEELCSRLTEVCSTFLRNDTVCVFFHDHGPLQASPSGTDAHTLAGKVLQAIASRSPLRARVGIGAIKSNWHELADSYHEGRIALAGSPSRIASYVEPSAVAEQVFASVNNICRSISDRKLADARIQVLNLPLLVKHQSNRRGEQFEAQRCLFIYALDAMQYTAREIGAGVNEPLGTLGAEAVSRANSAFELQVKFVECAQTVLDAVRHLYAGRPRMLLERTSQLIERNLSERSAAQSISIGRIAAALGISGDHLTRVIKRTTGLTFERYLMTRRVEAAKRMLLEPLASVSEVGEDLGFSDPAYFARVFHKIAGCSPSAYRNDPMRFSPPAAEMVSSIQEM